MSSATHKRTRSVSQASKLKSRKRQPRHGEAKYPTADLDQESDGITEPSSLFRSQASFVGLPTELRLEIYSHLCDTIIIHVHHQRGSGGDHFTWTPCRSASASSPLLCAAPKWSGMCQEEDGCAHRPGMLMTPKGAWALVASNKLIRSEAHEIFFRKSVVSIHPQVLAPWLDYITQRDLRHVKNLERITLAGPNSWRVLSKIELNILRDRVPNLRGLGVQCQDPVWRWARIDAQQELVFDSNKWQEWNVVDWVRSFDPKITVALEAMIWNSTGLEEQVSINIIYEGKGSASVSSPSWREEDVAVNVVRSSELGPCLKGSQWKQWWQGKGMEQWTVPSPFYQAI